MLPAFLKKRQDPATIYRLLGLTFHCMDTNSPNCGQIIGAAVGAVNLEYIWPLHLATI